MDIVCDWEFIDKDINKKWTIISTVLFIGGFLSYILLEIFAKYPHRYTNISVWLCVLSFAMLFFSKTPRFFWRETTIKVNKTNEGQLVVYINQGVLDCGFAMDCKYIFSDYEVFINKSLGQKVLNVKGPCVVQYLYNEQIFGIDDFENKWLTIRAEQEEIPICAEYFQI